jgi:hypothetical protein
MAKTPGVPHAFGCFFLIFFDLIYSLVYPSIFMTIAAQYHIAIQFILLITIVLSMSKRLSPSWFSGPCGLHDVVFE